MRNQFLSKLSLHCQYISPIKMSDQTNEKNKKRSGNWSDEEVLALLKIWREPDIVHRVQSVARDKTKLWNDIGTLLHDKGFPTRTGKQIHAKIKGLKSLYRTLHDQQNTSGEAAVRHPFWDDLQDILGGRANVNPPEGTVGGSMPLDDGDEDKFKLFKKKCLFALLA